MKQFILTQMTAAILVALLFALTGAFSSDEITGGGRRILFWLAILPPIWISIAASSYYALRVLKLPLKAGLFVVLSFSFLMALPATSLVWMVYTLFAVTKGSFFDFFPQTVLASALISSAVWLVMYLSPSVEPAETAAAEETAAGMPAAKQKATPGVSPGGSPGAEAALLKRLPLSAQGRLLALAAADHYLEVHTERGSGLIRMRMQDALALLPDELGMRIHRSYWVAFSAMERLRMVDKKPVLRLQNGAEYPVSRAYLRALRAKIDGQ